MSVFQFDHSYRRDLPGTWLPVQPEPAPAPKLVLLNDDLAADLGLDPVALAKVAPDVLGGGALPDGADPIAQAYAGHQFGNFVPQLGDGRAILLGEVQTPKGRFDIQLKGAGPTPFSRGGDGRAALGPMLREYLMGEAMAALGIPTTRALAVVATGRQILRDRALPGAVLTRVAASHIRIGTFQFFDARGQTDQIRALADYTIARHYPHLAGQPGRYLALLDAVIGVQARLIAQWMGVGFIHGVMNTDNMALSGETIDYGPCAFVDAYAAGTVFSSIDRTGRYALANQPLILGWNIARLAEALLPLIDPDGDRAVELANAALEGIAPRYRSEWLAVMGAKLGLDGPADAALADDFLRLVAGHDWTDSFTALGAGAVPDAARWADWVAQWQAARAPDWAARMARANPAIIPRNHAVDAALSAATEGDMAPFHAILAAVKRPFAPQPADLALLAPPPADAPRHVTFCGT